MRHQIKETKGIEVLAPVSSEQAELFSLEAQHFLVELLRKFQPDVKQLLKRLKMD